MDRREEIYDKALELFIADGYDQTSLSKIAKALNLTKGGLYHYFSSKEELLFFIHEHNLKKDFIPIIDAANKINDPEKRIAYFLKNHTEKALTKNAALRVLIHEIAKLKPNHRKKVTKIWKRAFDLIRDAVAELEASGRIHKINKTFATFAAIGMCSWTIYWFDYSRQESAEELADSYLNIFFKGLLKK